MTGYLLFSQQLYVLGACWQLQAVVLSSAQRLGHGLLALESPAGVVSWSVAYGAGPFLKGEGFLLLFLLFICHAAAACPFPRLWQYVGRACAQCDHHLLPTINTENTAVEQLWLGCLCSWPCRCCVLWRAMLLQHHLKVCQGLLLKPAVAA